MLDMDLDLAAVVEQIGSVLDMDFDLAAVVVQPSELSGCLD